MTDIDLMREARGWIADCTWGDDPDLEQLTDEQVRRGIQRHYSGGWATFVADSRPFVSEVTR